jgi:hypothetical protein
VIQSHHGRRLRELLASRRQEILEGLADELLPRKNYLTLVGLTWGLNEAIKFSEQVDSELSGEG